MLTQNDNEMITRTGPSTPMGDYLRRFWIPALCSNEISEPGIRIQSPIDGSMSFPQKGGQRVSK